jgi:uncharacterized repeat protein (TIGR01451 family)
MYLGQGSSGLAAANPVTVTNSAFVHNRSNPGGGLGGEGGGLFVERLVAGSAPVTLTNVTVAANTANAGGGLFHESGVLNALNVTVAANAAAAAGGVAVAAGAAAAFNATNSLFADNTATDPGQPPDFAGAFATASHVLLENPLGASGIADGVQSNLVGRDPALGPLADHGGPTPTLALLPGSPALDTGDATAAGLPDFDQRGAPFARVSGAGVDLGAFELQVNDGDLAVSKTDNVLTVAPRATLTYVIVVANNGTTTVRGATVTDTLPAGLGRASWTTTATGGAAAPAGGSGDINTTVDLPPGASVTFTLTATVLATASGTLVNTATVTPPAGVTDPDLSNDTATDTDTVTGGGGESAGLVVAGADAGATPHVRVFDGRTGALVREFLAYDPAFRGGVRVALGDVTGDGVLDVLTGAGPGGGPHVKVFDGATGAEVRSFFAFDAAFTGGVFVAAGDVNGDGFADVVVGADGGGGPHVKVFDGKDGALLFSFFAYDAGFHGGVRVGAGDVNGDGFADLITGAGPGAGRTSRSSAAGMAADWPASWPTTSPSWAASSSPPGTCLRREEPRC